MHAAQYFSMFLCLLAALHCQLLLQFIQLATNFSLTERLSFTFCLTCHFYSLLHEIQPMGHRSVSFISWFPSRRMVPYSERGCRSTSLASVSSYGFAMDFLFDFGCFTLHLQAFIFSVGRGWELAMSASHFLWVLSGLVDSS